MKRIMLLFCLSSGISAQDVYTDNFDSAPQLPWTNVRGNWVATAGTYAAQAPNNLPPTAALLPYAASDFSFEVDLIEPVDGGIWVRTNGTATAGVILVVFPDRMYWHVIADPLTGPYTSYGEATISPPLGSGANRIRVTGSGAILRAYVREQTTATATLDLNTVSNPPGLDYLSGRVGLYDNAGPGTRFDNVRLQIGRPVEVVVVGSVDNGTVSLFTPDAGGDATPVAKLSGANTGLSSIRGVAMDSDDLFVSSETGHSVKAFALGSLGNVAPLRSIVGAATGLGDVYQIDHANGELFAPSNTGPLSVFGSDDNGDVAPRRTIDGMTGVYTAEVDTDELFLTRDGSTSNAVYVFDRTAGGSASPIRFLSGPNTGLSSFNFGMAVTATELYVCEYYAGIVQVYPRAADGDTPPIRSIGGSNTGLSAPVDLTIQNGQLFVANSGTGSVLVFAADANGNVAPLRTIGGASTGISVPFALTTGILVVPNTIFVSGFESPAAPNLR